MPLRERLKRTFTGGKKSDDNTPAGDKSPKHKDVEKPDDFPKPKYRGKIDKEHADRLQAFTFSDAFSDAFGRRKSSMSGTCSPGGTKSQSRRASWMSKTKSSATGVGSGSDRDSKSLRRKSVVPDKVRENRVDDTDVANAGLSRKQTAEVNLSADNETRNALNLEKTVTHGAPDPSNDTPFSTEDLEKAMTKATLKPQEDHVVAKEDTVTVA